MDTFVIKPVNPAIRPRDPDTGARLAAEGEEKPVNTYWLRRQLAEEVEIVAPPNSSPAPNSNSAPNSNPASNSEKPKA